jgi:hypothetical protein
MGEPVRVKSIVLGVRDLYWDNSECLGRTELLHEIVARAREACWSGDFDNAWADWEVKLVGDCWHDITIRTATEELGWPRRFTRARCTLHMTRYSAVAGAAVLIWTALALLTFMPWAMASGAAAAGLLLLRIGLSRRNCLKAAVQLCAQAALRAGLAAAFDDEGPGYAAEPAPPYGVSPEPATLAFRSFAAAGKLALAARLFGEP